VRVEAIIGRINSDGFLEETEVLSLAPQEQNGHLTVFRREFLPQQTGRLGYSIRISPNHYDDPLTRPCHPLLKWG
jgi:starch phosphorylase